MKGSLNIQLIKVYEQLILNRYGRMSMKISLKWSLNLVWREEKEIVVAYFPESNSLVGPWKIMSGSLEYGSGSERW